MRAILPVAGRALVREVPKPTPRDGHLVMRVIAASLNRADLLQLSGNYSPPKGVTDVLGLEAAGLLPDGTLAGALVSGGALADYVSVPNGNILQIPSLDPVKLAAVPEAFLVAHHLLFQLGNFSSGQCVLINASGSGIGTAAIQLARTIPNTRIIASARGEAKREMAKRLGAEIVVDPTLSPRETSSVVAKVTDGKGVDLILDCVGAEAFRENARSVRTDGTWVLYGLLSGSKSSELTLAPLLGRRIKLIGTTLRSRSDPFKASLISEFSVLHGKHFSSNDEAALKPIISRVYEGLESTEEALEQMRNNENVGKIVIRLDHYHYT